ncbi:hypothetical protein [Rhizobium sp. 1399]|nr:hypothetical protein [Rhizobium sp. 1399]MDR6666416.1 hypothetical protein [Rhizobium sp. 1399]
MPSRHAVRFARPIRFFSGIGLIFPSSTLPEVTNDRLLSHVVSMQTLAGA